MKLNTILRQLLPLVLTTAPVWAQGFAGRYTAAVTTGEAVLELQPAGPGAFKGTLNLPNATALQLTGSIQGSQLSGVASASGESERFTAKLNGQQLTLTVGNIELPFTRQPAAAPPTPAKGASEVNDPSLGFRFRAPAGYTAQPDGIWYVLVSPQSAARVLVMRHTAENIAEIRKLSEEGFSYGKGVQLTPVSGVQMINGSTLAADLAGTIEGQQARARMIVVQSPYGGGAIVLAGGSGSTPAEYTSLADTVVRSIQFQKVDAAPALQFWTSRLRGKKLHYFSRYSSGYGSGSGYAQHKQMSLCSDGSFYFNGEFSGAMNVPGATASMGRNSGDAGRWKLTPNLDQATLVLTFANGSKTTYNLANQEGKTLLNGTRWLVEDSKECR
ncbi:MAG TPA: hypothetical protein VM120_06030 [Bryobacteraceae bacterium]|nr:hypothetical protein [Bryobacteraceae bacterium]